MTPGNAPPAAHEDLLLGPWLEHAREHVPDGNAILWRDAVDFTGDSASGIQGMLNMVWVLRSGLDNPRYAYLPIDPDHPSAGTFASALGATHIPELDFDEGPHRVQCHVLDYGENGLLGMQRAVVYMELGLAPPTVEAAVAAAPTEQVDPEVVREALRNLRVPVGPGRAASWRAGDGVEERAASVRALLEDAAEKAFGEGENEQLLKRVLTRGYLDPAAEPRGGRGRAEPQPGRLFPASEAGFGAPGGVPVGLRT